MNMANDYDYLKELFNASLEPIRQTMFELKGDVKILNDRLLINREKYAEDIQALTSRMDKMEAEIEGIEPKSSSCQFNFDQKILSVATKVTYMEETLDVFKKEIAIVLWISKNPRLFIAIIIGLYLLSISNVVPEIIKSMLLK